MNSDVCPISGLPILCKPEWANLEISKDYHVTFQKIGNNILNHLPCGEMKAFDSEIYYEFREKVIKDAFSPEIKIIDMKDYGNLKGFPRVSERIKMYHQLIREQFRCIGYIVYNSSVLVRLMYQTAFYATQNLPYNAKVVIDYPAAVRIAMDILGMNNRSENKFLSDEGFFQRDGWVYKSSDGKCQIEFMVSNDNILICIYKGILTSGELGYLRKTLFQIYEDRLVSNGFSIISDYKQHQQIDSSFRRSYLEIFRGLRKKFNVFPHSVYICGVSDSMKASFLFTHPFDEIEFLDSYQDALKKIRNPEIYGKIKKYISVPTKDIEKIVYLIGSITWEREESAAVCLESTSPLKYVEEALSIVNIDHKEFITELKARNEILRQVVKELKEASDLAQAANQAKTDFLANMSHELRTPLNGIIGMAEILNETQLSAEQKLSTDIIQQSGRNLLSLINDILDHAKIESGKFVLEKTNFNCYKIIEEVIELIAHQAYEKQLTLIVNISSTIHPLFSGDILRLKQILLNFISNAIKFTSEGNITVNVNEISDNETYQDISFEIHDTGIGIEKDKMDLIFGQFTQIDSSITRKYGGTGLGLSLAKQLINLMDGIVSVSSKPGEGSRFHFSLPFAKVTPMEEDNEKKKMNLSNKCALIFAEVEAERLWYMNQLSNFGCSILFSGNLINGVDQYVNLEKRDAPDHLIIMDPGFSLDLSLEKAYRKITKAFPGNQFRYIFLWNSTIKFYPDFKSDYQYASLLTKPMYGRKLENAIRSIFNNV